MKLKVIIISLWASICLLMACYEDKGNYDLVDYNQIEKMALVSSLSKSSITLGDTLKLVMDFTWKYPDRDTSDAAFEFVWKLTWSGDTISRERDLIYVPDECGTFSYYLFVTEKATGVVSRYSAYVTVKSPYLIGWMIGSMKDGKPTINYIRRDSWKDDDNKTHYYWSDFPDLYSDLQPASPLPDPELLSVTAYTIDGSEDEVVVIQEGGHAIVLNGDDLGKVLELRDEFQGAAYPAGFEPMAFCRGGYCDFAIGQDGNIYWRRNQNSSAMHHEAYFMDIPVYFPGGGSRISKVFDVNTYKSECILLHDELNNRLVGCYTSYSSGNSYLGAKLDIINTNDPNTFMDLLNLGDNKLIYCGDHTDGKNFVTIVKNANTGEYMYQSFAFSGNVNTRTVIDATQEVFAGNHLVSDNTVYWRLRTSGYLYFGEGSKLYFYDVNTKAVKEYTDFGDGARITHILQDADCTSVGVALNDGRFYICDAIDPEILGAANPGETGILHRVHGLGDIKSVSWKSGGYYNLVFERYQ